MIAKCFICVTQCPSIGTFMSFPERIFCAQPIFNVSESKFSATYRHLWREVFVPARKMFKMRSLFNLEAHSPAAFFRSLGNFFCVASVLFLFLPIPLYNITSFARRRHIYRLINLLRAFYLFRIDARFPMLINAARRRLSLRNLGSKLA